MEKITDHLFLETLELRIAPAGLLSFQDTDGDSVVVKLAGAGTVTGDHTGLTLSDTDPLKSVLTISVKKAKLGDGLADLDSISGSGLSSLAAAKIDFTGAGVALTGALGKVLVHDLLNGADITAGGTTTDRSVVVAGHLSAGSQIALGSTLTSFTAFEADGDKYTISLKGTGGFHGDLNDGLSLINTTNKSTLGIAVTANKAGGDGFVSLTSIDAGSGFAGLAAINAPSVNLTDHVTLNTTVGKIALGGIHDASLTLGGTSIDKTTFTAGHIINSDLTFGGSLTTFTTPQFDSGSLTAPVIALLNIAGDVKAGLPGDLGATVKTHSVGYTVIKHNLTGSIHTDTSLTASDADGDKYIVSVKGGGSFQGDMNSGLSLINTTSKSTLSITVTKASTSSDGFVDLTAIDAGSGFTGLAAIAAPLVNLTDHLTLNTTVGSIVLGTVQNASIHLGGTAVDKTTFTGGRITNSNLVFGDTLSSFTATQFDSGSLTAAAISLLSISGDIKSGLPGDLGAAVRAGTISYAAIKHDLTGSLQADNTLTYVTIGHDVIGGAARASGAILAGSSIGSVTITGDLRGGSGELSGTIFQYTGNLATDLVHTLINPGANASVQTTAITVNGSVVGGTGDYSGGILVHNINTLTIKGDLVGGDNTTAGDLRNTGFIYGTLINTLTIGNSILAGNNTGGGTMENSGAINLRSYVGALSVGKDIAGTATQDVTLTSFGLIEQTSHGPGIFGLTGSQLGFGKITVKGSVIDANILAGVDGMGFDNVALQTNNALETGVPGDLDPTRVNTRVGIGVVLISGNLTDSQIVAGFTPGTDGVFGTYDDVAGTAIGSISPYGDSVSNIAAVVVGGKMGAVGSSLSSTVHGQITVAPGAAFPSIHALSQLNIIFNYDYDTSGFFSDPLRRALLDEAAAVFESRLPASDFDAVLPGNGDSWNLSTFNPSNINGASLHISNEILSAGTIIIYVGASSGDSNILAQGGPATYFDSGSVNWENALDHRQDGSTFHTVGGSIRFNSNTDFYFDSDPNTMESFSGEDFYSVAVHELGHVMGFLDSALAFDNNVTRISGTSYFTGSHAETLYGGPVPLSPDLSHWKDGILYNGQALSMDPTIANGTRKVFTDLDWAALEDIGYHVLA